jgi:hypothetical protein
VTEFCVVEGPKEGQNVGQMKMTNAIKAVRFQKMGMKKRWKVYEFPTATLKNKINFKERDRETDQ